ncbi:hypothetical protein ES708_18123 [subsurface metagenome]
MEYGSIVNLGAASAIIITVSLFLAHLRKTQRESRAEREAERKESRAEREAERVVLMDLIRNDLAHVGTGLAESVEAQHDVVNGLREVRSALERLNGKKGDQR